MLCCAVLCYAVPRRCTAALWASLAVTRSLQHCRGLASNAHTLQQQQQQDKVGCPADIHAGSMLMQAIVHVAVV